MPGRIQLVAIVGSALLLVVVLEMVRRRRLMERYALLWLLSAIVLLALASWNGALVKISRAVGVIYPPNALFFIAFGFVLVLLLHFSAAVSRLSDQTKVLAQRLALLDERLRRYEGEEDPETPEDGERRELADVTQSLGGRPR
ncbi:MAG: DUF2304 domain-containing protein [Solirubrobacteraceae bacterium]